MKRRLPYLFLTLILLASCWLAVGQGKVYTRKLRLADFPAKTTKMVLAGNSFLELTLREEISAHWRISPFEFCTPDEYGRLRSSSDYYFLTLVQEDGIAFLSLSKGGKEDEKDDLKKPFEVVRMPMASMDNPTGRELVFMGAFINIIQQFVEEAMLSDKTAYGGLSATGSLSLKGRTVYLDPDAADEAFLRKEPDALSGLVIAPGASGAGRSCYKMLISADTHELFYYEKSRYRGPSDAAFSDADARRFTRRGAVVKR